MDEVSLQFLYQPNILLELGLLLSILYFTVKPQGMTALVALMLLLRPNERFDCFVPYTKISFFLLLLLVMSKLKELSDVTKRSEVKLLLSFISLAFVEMLLFHREYLVRYVVYVSTGLLLYFAILIFMKDDRGMRIINYTTVFGCFLICLEPLYYHYAEAQDSATWKLFHWDGRLQAWGLWGNANETSFLACVGVANLLILATRGRKKVDYALLSVLTPFFMVIVFLTGSRAGLASMILVFVPLFFFMKSRTAKICILLTCLAALAASVSLRPERTDTEASSRERNDLRYVGRQLFLENPVLGVGFGMAPEHTGGQPLHNTYLQAFAETGLLGGLLLVACLFKMGNRLYGALMKGNKDAAMVNGLNGVAGLFLSSLFYNYWGNQLLSIMFFLVIAQVTSSINGSLLNRSSAI